jgi:hypothetical protein
LFFDVERDEKGIQDKEEKEIKVQKEERESGIKIGKKSFPTEFQLGFYTSLQ